MKREMFKKTVLFVMGIAIAMLMTNCKSSKNATGKSEGEVLIKQYCTGEEYRSDENYIRSNFSGESNDMVMSKKVARANTLEELASKIQVTVKSVIDNYYNRRQLNLDENVSKRYEELTRLVVKQEINGYKTVCEKVVKTTDNKYRTYLAFELPIDSMLNPIYNKISSDKELKIDYDYEKFKKTFEEEMQKMENQ